MQIFSLLSASKLGRPICVLGETMNPFWSVAIPLMRVSISGRRLVGIPRSDSPICCGPSRTLIASGSESLIECRRYRKTVALQVQLPCDDLWTRAAGRPPFESGAQPRLTAIAGPCCGTDVWAAPAQSRVFDLRLAPLGEYSFVRRPYLGSIGCLIWAMVLRARRLILLRIHGARALGVSRFTRLLSEVARLKWRRPGSNRQPPGCKPGAFPIELRPRIRRSIITSHRPIC